MASLTVIQGPDRGRRFELDDKVPTIGRDAKNSIRLHDSEISRQHAEFRQTDNGFIVRDLNSSNGTYLNGERIEYGAVKTGDRIRVGRTELIFTADSPQVTGTVDLANKINMVTRRESVESSAIIRSIKHSEGSQLLRYPESADSQWLKHNFANLNIIYETSQAITRISDIDELLDHIMNLVFTTIRADRGCVMLKNVETGKLEPTAVRYAQGVDTEEQITLSRTIMDYVLDRKEGVIVLDAAHDQRFNSAQSIVQLGIREAMCVPLLGRHDTLGVMYVDTKSDNKEILKTQEPSKFTDDKLKLMIAIAHQAGLAIEDSRYYQAMVQAERLAAVGQTIATVSHHIKNILQGLKSGSYLVEMGLSEKKLDLLERGWSVVQKNQGKIYNLVMDMLSYSKEREPALEMVDPNRIVQDILELMEPRAKELGVKLDAEYTFTAGEVALDPEAMHRALLNLVSNAIDAVEGTPNGSVHIQTAADAKSRYLYFTVADNGCGIPEDRQEQIFQVFSSTKGSKGTGLGLPVSLKIAQEHGGTIRVESEIDKGSRFTIETPIRRVSVEPLVLPENTLTDTELRTQLAADEEI
ncbi:MAG: ATP-binding protein [Planctomycetota bacterium]